MKLSPLDDLPRAPVASSVDLLRKSCRWDLAHNAAAEAYGQLPVFRAREKRIHLIIAPAYYKMSVWTTNMSSAHLTRLMPWMLERRDLWYFLCVHGVLCRPIHG